MSVGRDVIADHWEVEKDDVRCENCEAFVDKLLPDCEFWKLSYPDVKRDQFCSFWNPKGGVSE